MDVDSGCWQYERDSSEKIEKMRKNAVDKLN